MTYTIVIAGFSIQNKLRKIKFFEEIFLLIIISKEVILEILFLIFYNANIQFAEKKLKCKRYIIAKALFITQKVEFINKKEFTTVILNENTKTFMIYIATLLATSIIQVYPFFRPKLGYYLLTKLLSKSYQNIWIMLIFCSLILQ